MSNLRWLKWAIARHFRQQGFTVRLASINLGNAAIDGEVLGKGWRMALEIKTPGDHLVRGLGQLSVALAHGYDSAALVTTLRNAKRINPETFDKLGFVLRGVDSRGNLEQVYPTCV